MKQPRFKIGDTVWFKETITNVVLPVKIEFIIIGKYEIHYADNDWRQAWYLEETLFSTKAEAMTGINNHLFGEGDA